MLSYEIREEYGLKPRYMEDRELKRFDSFRGCLQLALEINKEKKDGLILIGPHSRTVMPFTIPEQSRAFWHVTLDHPNQEGGRNVLVPNFRTITQNYALNEERGEYSFNWPFRPPSAYQFPYYAFDVLASFQAGARVRQRIYLSNIVNGDRDFQIRIIRNLAVSKRRNTRDPIKENPSGYIYPSTCYVVDKVPVSPEREITEDDFRYIFRRNRYDWVSPVPDLALRIERKMTKLILMRTALEEVPRRIRRQIRYLISPEYKKSFEREEAVLKGFDKPYFAKFEDMLTPRRNK